MNRQYKWLCIVLLIFLAACGGGEEPAVDTGSTDEPVETTEVVETTENVVETEDVVETNEAEGSAEVTEAEGTDADDMPEQPASEMEAELVEVSAGGFAFSAPAGYEVSIEGESAELTAEGADPDNGPQIFMAGGPLDGVTTDVMAGFMLSNLAEEEGFAVGELTETTVNGLSGYTADYEGQNGDVPLQGRLLVFGDDSQAILMFGGGPADVWGSTTAAEFEALANSVALLAIAAETADAGLDGVDKSDKPATTTAGGEAITIDPSAAGMACFSTDDAAVSCLTADGQWQYFDDDNSPLGGNRVAAMAVCPDGTLLMGHLFGISALKDGEWREYSDDWGTGSIDAIDCDADGGIWIAHFQGVSTFDGSGWTTYGSELLEGTEDYSGLVSDVTIAPDGVVWVVTSNTIAAFAGREWTVYDEDALGDLYFFETAVMGADGLPRVAHSSGVLAFDGSAWSNSEGNFYSAETAAVDVQDNIWVGTFSDGLFQLSGGSWGVEGLDTGMSSNGVNAVTVDAAGRIWVGTDYGLNVFDGSGWQVYRMDNSELSDNEIMAMAVIGAGPELPETVDEPAGSMAGSLTLDGDPYEGALVEICVESLSSFFDGPTPCSDQQFYVSTTTNPDGSFVLADVPEGYYVITAETPQGWAQLTTEYGFGSERVLVYAGEETDIGELMITTEDE